MGNGLVRHDLLIFVFPTRNGFLGFRQLARYLCMLLVVGASVILLSGCRIFSRVEPTRTPIPTFTPTPILVVVPAGAVPTPADPQQAAPPGAGAVQPVQELPTATQAPTVTPAPPTNTPTIPPTVTPTNTPAATAISTSTPTPIPDYQFELESAQKFPTQSLALNVVRVYLYVYAPGNLGLADYGLQILHNGAPLAADAVSKDGLPELTRQEPGPYTRFTNMNVIIVEAQAGEWIVQLVDTDGRPVGPPAKFELSADEDTRELYVRYRQSAN